MPAAKASSAGRLPHALYFQVFGFKPGRGEERRIRIIEAFIDSVATLGLEHTSYETLAKKVRMNRTHVAYYFPNRDELIRTAVRYSISMAQQITISQVERARSWKDRLRIVVSGPFDWLDKNPKHASILLLYCYLCTYDKNYRALQNSIRSMGEQRITSCFPDAVLEGKQDIIGVTRSIQAMTAGALQNYFSADFPSTLLELRDAIVRSSIQLVGALLSSTKP